MDLIIQPEEVGILARPLSQHIDREQLVAYITEVEQLQIRPTLGVVLYSNIKQSPSTFAIILNGGIDEFGDVSGGIRKAMAYYAYARIIREGGTIPTRWGAVEKNDEYATRIDQERKNTIHRECVNIADTYMAEVINYSKAQGWITTEGINQTRRMAYIVGDETQAKAGASGVATVKTEADIVQGEGILINGNIVSVDFSSVASMGIVTDVEAKADEAKRVATEAQENAERAFSGISDNTEAVVEALTKANNAEKKATATSTALEAEVAERKAQDSVMDKRITDVEVNVSDISKRATTAETKVAEVETAISDLQKKDKTHDDDLQRVENRVTTAEGKIMGLQGSVTNNTNSITANAEALAKQAKELGNKAPKSGYAPDLKVDFAKELVGRGVAEPQEIGTIRPTGVISIGDGNATIEKVKGNSVVWNQLSKTEGYKKYMPDNISLSISGNTINVTSVAYEGASGDSVMIYCYASTQPQIGDKLFVNTKFKSSNASLTPTVEFCGSNVAIKNEGVIYSAVKSTDRIYLKASGTKLIGDTWSFSDIEVVNLTQMFGANNEPTTIAEFEARKPLGVSDDYNEGEIISYDGANELKSVGFNAFNGSYAKVIGGQQYHALGTITSIGFTTELGGETTVITLDSEGMFTPTESGYVYAEGSDICIHLTHTYTPEHTTEYEEDILTLPNIKAIKDKDGNLLFPYGLLSAGSAYDEITATKAVKRIDKRAFAEGDNEDSTVLTDGKETLFALAEPIEVDLPEPLNLTYDAWDFGTEELVAEGKTTPLNADIVYQFNAVDRIRENTAKNQALEAELAELKAQLTQLTQVTNDEDSNAQ